MTGRPNLAYFLLLYDPQAKNGFYDLNSWGKIKRRIFYDLMKII
jgi:hypothetical protein